MSKNKEPIIISRKKYFEILKKYEALSERYEEVLENHKTILGKFNNLEMYFLDEQRLNQEKTEEIENLNSIVKYYNDLVEQQLSPVLNVLTYDNIECYYEMISPIDYDDRCLWNTCYELLHINPSNTFVAEENMGWFESMSGRNLVQWAEIAAFHTINWKQSGMWELYDGSTFDESKVQEYYTYKFNLKYGTLQKIISEFPKLHRDFLSDAEEGGLSIGAFYSVVNDICRNLSVAYAPIFRPDGIEMRDKNLDQNTDFCFEDDLADDEEVEL